MNAIKKLSHMTILAAAVSVFSGSAIAGVSAPGAAATSYNDISNFSINFNTGSASINSFTFSNNTAANGVTGTANVDPMDAPASCVGACVGWNNDFFDHTVGTLGFAYGDAQIIDADVVAGTGQALAIGDVYSTGGVAHASGSNVMNAIIQVTTPTAFDFAFVADLFMHTELGPDGIDAAANTFFNITLTDSLTNAVAFSWSPDGVVSSGALPNGGIEIDDPFSLNTGIVGNGSYVAGFGSFFASTDTLSESMYSLEIEMVNQVNVAAVPVPAAVWLFASGLLGLVGVARRA